MKSGFRHRLVTLRHRNLTSNDVFLSSYPKSGNTWLRHLITYVVTQESVPWRGGVDGVSRLVGRHRLLPEVAAGGGRLIKTHEPHRASYRRAVLLVRDGRDVAVSEYYFQKTYTPYFYKYGNSFERFLNLFLKGKTNGYRAWHYHTSTWLDATADRQNDILVLPFERLKSEPHESLRSVVDHIGLEADDSLIRDAIADCSLESMKQKEDKYWKDRGESSKNFVRSGSFGGWRKHFTPELEEAFWKTAGSTMERLGYERVRLSQ
ncbi:sulfotransferase domain-containing protein [Rhodopirellula halodulae]|uniref:sulfotransferase domain-containing protein n=1 Tax=Rhodopirellula halodulae TaxID=2894198 RepID=UPI001E376AD1|nr:sulfotransferase domain-containing protein [Rhodopirellula sp. JC737]MCC9654429.1 sulfotransferase domain-containing protein [Rhodopirellula sp. JC737]